MEIKPILPAYPIIKPVRVEKDEDHNEKNPQNSHNPNREESPNGDNSAMHQIDEVV